MRRVSLSELQRDCNRLIDEVANGDVIEIVDQGKVVAQIIPATPENIALYDSPSK